MDSNHDCGGLPGQPHWTEEPKPGAGPCELAPVKGWVLPFIKDWPARAAVDTGDAQPITSINEMCSILKKRLIFSDEYTDCAILYTVTFDQLRGLYDLGRAASDTGASRDALEMIRDWPMQEPQDWHFTALTMQAMAKKALADAARASLAGTQGDGA